MRPDKKKKPHHDSRNKAERSKQAANPDEVKAQQEEPELGASPGVDFLKTFSRHLLGVSA
jgi:hypothetical protein